MSTDSHILAGSHTSPPMTLILTVALLAFFFIGFFSIFFCRCFMDSFIITRYLRPTPPEAPPEKIPNPGLDPSILKSFPTFTYSSVKDLRNEKSALECAVCISEFLDDEILRLLTVCCHVFHQECIDPWLEKHKTCPVCRRALDNKPESSQNGRMVEINEDSPLEDSVSIDIRIDEEDDENNREHTMIKMNAAKVEKFPRSHSTGHSIKRSVNSNADIDKHTLRLPDHLHAHFLRGHHWTGSCTTFGEFHSKTDAGNGGFGEISGFSGGDVNRV